MAMTNTPIRILALCAALAAAFPAHAQEESEAPAAQDAAPDDASKAKAKPKPKPKPKPSEAKAPDAKPAGAKAAAPLLEPAATAGPANWPNGASAISESYGDWTMNCTKGSGAPDCVIIQSQGDRRTGRRQFSIELRPPTTDRSEGLILMPFGMQIEAGVTFKLDDRALGKGAPYSYCVADGCLVPISLPTVATDAMKTAQSLTVSANKPDAKEPTVISVPLAGFAAAFARAMAFKG